MAIINSNGRSKSRDGWKTAMCIEFPTQNTQPLEFSNVDEIVNNQLCTFRIFSSPNLLDLYILVALLYAEHICRHCHNFDAERRYLTSISSEMSISGARHDAQERYDKAVWCEEKAMRRARSHDIHDYILRVNESAHSPNHAAGISFLGH